MLEPDAVKPIEALESVGVAVPSEVKVAWYLRYSSPAMLASIAWPQVVK